MLPDDAGGRRIVDKEQNKTFSTLNLLFLYSHLPAIVVTAWPSLPFLFRAETVPCVLSVRIEPWLDVLFLTTTAPYTISRQHYGASPTLGPLQS